MARSFTKRTVAFLAIAAVIVAMCPLGMFAQQAKAAASFVIPMESYEDLGLIGRGFNMLGDKYLKTSTLSASIFKKDISAQDLEKIGADGLSFSEYEGKFTFITDLSSYMQSNEFQTSLELKAEAKFKLLSMGMSAKYGITGSNSSETTTKMEYAVLEYTAMRERRGIDLSTQAYIKRLYDNDMLTEDFKRELVTLTPEALFNKYGTHIVTKYTSGGEMTVTYKNEDFSSKVSSADGWSSNASMSAGMEGLASFSATIEGKEDVSQTESGTTGISSTNTYVTGGDKVGIAASDLLSGNTSPDAWLESISDYQEIIVNDSLTLLPIWDLIIDAQYADVKVDLENYFNKHIRADYAALYGQYIYAPTEDEARFEDYTFITSVEELNAVHEDMDGRYVLLCDLELTGEWTPIGTKEAPFNGVFDANGCTISGVDVTKTVDGAAGFFGHIGTKGVVKNLTVSGTVSVDASDCENNLGYVGGIAGVNYGMVKNCRNQMTVSGTVSVTEADDPDAQSEEHIVYDREAIMAKIDEFNTIDLTTYEGGTISANTMAAIKLTGTATAPLNVTVTQYSKTPLYIVLEDAVLTGDSEDGTIYSNCARPIWVLSEGEQNSISAALETPAINAASANLTIIGDSPLVITGGKGADGNGYQTDGKTGANGTEGAVAVNATAMDIDLSATLTLQGGDGGNGAVGKKGTDGYSYPQDHEHRTGTGNGAKGGDGQVGGVGGAGGNGGIPMDKTVLVTLFQGNVDLIGGDAGNGGTGGTGGNGGRGQETGGWECTGGTGGTGGKGGTGGNSGLAVVPVLFENFKAVGGRLNLKKGADGEAGQGGSGGSGGLGGTHSNIRDPGAYWLTKGYAGASGPAGAKGTAGTVTVNDIKQGVAMIVTADKKYTVYNESLGIEEIEAKLSFLNDATDDVTAGRVQLVAIGSADEQAVVEELIALAGGTSYYIGLTWNESENLWKWKDGSTLYTPGQVDCDNSDGKYVFGNSYDMFDEVVYDNWDDGQPDAAGTENGQVAVILADGTWNDVSSTRIVGYITEETIGEMETMPVTDRNAVLAGGIVGYNAPEAIIDTVINEGDVTIDKAYSDNADITAMSGGIAAFNDGTVKAGYNIGEITAIAKTDSMCHRALAFAYEIGYEIDASTDAVLTGGVCEAVAKSANNRQHAETSTIGETTMTSAVQKAVGYWKNDKIGIKRVEKTSYLVRTEFDRDSVSITYNSAPVEKYAVRYYFLTPGCTMVTISYDEYARTFPVRVKEATVTAIKPDDSCNYQTEFVVDDVFSSTGLIVELQYDNQEVELVSGANKAVTVTAPDMSTPGRKTVMVAYGDHMTTYTIVVSGEEADLLYGDVNLDGAVNMMDVATLYNFVSGKMLAFTEQQKLNGDMNSDTAINMMDVVKLYNVISGREVN